MRHAGVAIAVGVLVVASPARADRDVPRNQVVGVDVAADAVVAVGVRLESPYVFGGGAAAYLLAAPVVHAVHGDWSDGAVSLGLRLALPVGGAFTFGLIGALTGGRGKSPLGAAAWGVLVGAAIGAVGAELYDVAFLAGPASTGPSMRGLAFGGAF